MKIAHLYPFLGRDKGGIAACLPPQLGALSAQGVKCRLISQRFAGDGDLASLGLGALDFEIARVPTRDKSGFGFAPALPKFVRATNADIIHSHGLWMWSDWVASRSARAQNKPHIVSPHGMLEPWAMANSARKKQLMWRVFQRRALNNARVLHALCDAEKQAMRALGLNNPIAVIANGVNLSEFAALPDDAAFDAEFPLAKNRKVLLFMARLHPKKGLVPLLHAWRELARDFPDWLLVIAGPDENGHRAELESLVEEFGLSESVALTGMLDGARKRAALARADAFVLPSFSEGFSIAILEAMACRLPVLLTPECHFDDAARAGAAIAATPEAPALIEGARALLERSDAERAQMGALGYDLVAQKYTWARVAHAWKTLYAWCDGQSEKPDFVEEIK